MATRVTLTTNLSASGIASISGESHSKQITLGGDSDIVDDTQDIGTSSEQISLGELSTNIAAVEIKNLDTTNFVSISFENPAVAGTKTFRIEAGASGLFPRPSGALYAIADTATVKILKKAVEQT